MIFHSLQLLFDSAVESHNCVAALLPRVASSAVPEVLRSLGPYSNHNISSLLRWTFSAWSICDCQRWLVFKLGLTYSTVTDQAPKTTLCIWVSGLIDFTTAEIT